MDFTAERERLVQHLGREIRDKRVLAAMSKIPRERFVPAGSRHLAYEDSPLPIGHGQTISQPYIIALMSEALALTGVEKVLELGTGSGYQTAILAELARKVSSVERVPELTQAARNILDELGYRNVDLRSAGKKLGCPAEAPFDAIMVTAAAPKVPPSLLEQLGMGGRMVIPAGSRYLQELSQITRTGQGMKVRSLGGCRFVSLIGEDAWEDREF